MTTTPGPGRGEQPQRCQAPGCIQVAVWMWQRAATAQEWEQVVTVAHQRHAEHPLGDELPQDVFVPTDGRAYQLVHACLDHIPFHGAAHALTPDLDRLAAIHQADCLPPCTCTELVTP